MTSGLEMPIDLARKVEGPASTFLRGGGAGIFQRERISSSRDICDGMNGSIAVLRVVDVSERSMDA